MTHELGSLLRRLRRAAGLTQEGLADRSGLSVEGISLLERGLRSQPRDDTVDLLVTGLELDDDQEAQLRRAVRAGRQSQPSSATQRRPDDASEAASDDAAAPDVPVPRQLPAAPTHLVGRDLLVDRVAERLVQDGDPSVHAFVGMGGVGKSATTLHVAHRVADQYPDGQLYVDLHGQSVRGQVHPAAALSFLIGSLGGRVADLPPEVDQLAAYYRSLLASRRVLLVLDDVASDAQLAALMPGTPEVGVVVTSRATPTVPDVVVHHLPRLPADASRRLLELSVGQDEVTDDPVAADAVLEVCDGLPLALRVLGARLTAMRHWSLAHVAQRLDAAPDQLAELRAGDLTVRDALGASLDQLDAGDELDQDAARLLRLIGLLPHPELRIETVAALCAVPVEEAERLVLRLVEVSLLEPLDPWRYRVQALVQAVARAQATERLDAQDCRSARLRLLRTYRATAWRSRVLTRPTPSGLDEELLTVGALGETAEQALDALEREASLVIALVHDLQPGEEREAAQLVLGLISYFVMRVDTVGWVECVVQVLDPLPASERLLRVWLLQDLVLAFSGRGEQERALESARLATDLAAALGDDATTSSAWGLVALVLGRMGRDDEALTAARTSVRLGEGADERTRAAGHRDLGLQEARAGDLPAAIVSERRALELYECADVPRGVAMALINLGVVQRDSGQVEDSLRSLERAVEASRTARDRQLESEALDELGYWHVLHGRPEEGLRALTDGLALVDDQGPRREEVSLRLRLALALEALGRLDEARREREAATHLSRSRGEPQRVAQILGEPAECECQPDHEVQDIQRLLVEPNSCGESARTGLPARS